MGVWLLAVLCMGASVKSDPIGFDPFFIPETSYFSPPEDGKFGTFSGSYGDGGLQLGSEFPTIYPAETSNLPLYTDGRPTPPQETLSKLEKDYKTQLHRVANLNLRQNSPKEYRSSNVGSGSPTFSKRFPRFHSEPFSSASNVNERKLDGGKAVESPYSPKPVQLQTGFVPIIKGSKSSSSQRAQNTAGSALKSVEPPILTAASVSSKPTLFKVSASVQSSTKVSPGSQQPQNATRFFSEDNIKPRQASYSRFLDLNNASKSFSTSSSSSESVVSRVVVKPPSPSYEEPRDLSRLSSGVSEDVKLAAKKTLDINCDGSRDLGWCELGDKYPKKYVNQVVASCQEVIERMYVEVPHSFERLSDTSNFKAELDNSSTQREARERGSHDAWSWASYFHQGALCDAETGFLRPETAKDSSGKWNIIVQTESLKQRIPLEMCRKTNSSCKKMLNCGLKSQCLQKYNYHLLLSLNPVQKHDCPFMKLYRFPSACVCHVE